MTLYPANLDATVRRKLDRLTDGSVPRVFDLFSGCGGMTLGFVSAGCRSVGGVELDAHAARSHQENFHQGVSAPQRELFARPRDITTSDPHTVLRELGVSKTRDAVDILVGGPPCPSFTRVGRAKLRATHGDPKAFLNDPRGQLYLPYLRFVHELAPVAILMENVPDFLNWGGQNVAETVCDALDQLGYQTSYTLLNAANYGVPQYRERFFLIALHRQVEASPVFPTPTHSCVLPPGYQGTRNFALGTVNTLLGTRYIEAPHPTTSLPPSVQCREAVDDLPRITNHLHTPTRRGAKRLDVYMPVAPLTEQSSVYAELMRTWPGFESTGQLPDHVTRGLSQRDYRLFRSMVPGDDYPKAHFRAVAMFQEELRIRAERGSAVSLDSPEYMVLLREYVPPYDTKKFPNKWRKLEADQPARTLMAHLGKDTYSHIHYDDTQARTITIREAARLQSFPDGFKFAGTMNPAFRQIGNAVPPLLATHLAASVLRSLGAAHSPWVAKLVALATSQPICRNPMLTGKRTA